MDFDMSGNCADKSLEYCDLILFILFSNFSDTKYNFVVYETNT